MKRTYAIRLISLGVAGLTIPACPKNNDLQVGDPIGSTSGNDDESNGGTTSTTGTTGVSTTFTTGTTTSTSTPTTTAGDATVGATDTDTDTDTGGNEGDECDVWLQNCGEGLKCAPVSDTPDGATWTTQRCVPVNQPSVATGASCLAGDGPYAGNDNCGPDAMCFYVHEGVGMCVEFCEGSLASPSCPEETICINGAGGLVPVCRPECDPTDQAFCQTGECAWSPGTTTDTFLCFGWDRQAAGSAGDPCEGLNVCQPGLICVGAELLPNAECDATSCCTNFCNLDGPNNGDDECELGATHCEEWYLWPDGTPPVGSEHIGFCVD